MAIIFTNKTIHGNVHVYEDKIIKLFNTNDIMVDQECLLSLMFSQYIPNYVPIIYNYHKEQGYTYLMMEKIIGITFREFLKYKHDISLKYKIVKELVEGLKNIHKLGYCHKDFHDENIIITTNYHVKIIDFGCTQIISEDGLYDDYIYLYMHIAHLLFEIDAEIDEVLYVTDELGPEDVVGNNLKIAQNLYGILENIYIENNL